MIVAASVPFHFAAKQGKPKMSQPVLEVRTESGTIVLAPKNRGLRARAMAALGGLAGEIDESAASFVRGEDVPMIANALARGGRRFVALTGEDLLEEWLAQGNTLSPSIRRSSVPWNDPDAIYGKPALCFVGKNVPPPNARLRVAIAARYKSLAEGYLQSLEVRGSAVERIVVNGALEAVYAQGIADCIVDIVVTGATMREYGLRVLDVIFTSDLALLEA
jgi:ATP phosphoribosyltransferase